MVSLSTFYNNIITLINQYVYTKEETKENFDNFIENEIRYVSGNLIINDDYLKTLWQPALNGETGASYKWSYSESDGEAIGKGFVLNNGFKNTDEWELSFEFKHDNIRYTGICFLAELGQYNGSGGATKGLTSWEGSWPNGTAYSSYTAGAVGWFDITVTKIDDTHINIKSDILDRNTNVEVLWMENAIYLSCGARHNDSGSSYGPCRIRNVKVVAL